MLSYELSRRNVDLLYVRITGDLPDDHVLVERLPSHEPSVVAAGSQNPLTRRRRIELAELVHEPWTLSPPDTIGGSAFAEAFRLCGLKAPQPTVTAVSLHVRYRLLTSGRFLTVLPRLALPLSGSHLPLKALPVELPRSRATGGIVVLRNRTITPLAEIFINAIRAVTRHLARA
jgi:DNA-binding transcriptional LysR family regulator